MAQPHLKLSNAIIAVVSEALADRYSHTKLNSLFEANGAPGDPPTGVSNKIERCKAWLRAANQAAPSIGVLQLLGAVLCDYMDAEIPEGSFAPEQWAPNRERIKQALGQSGLRYATGGKIFGGALSAPTKSLDERLRQRDLKAVEAEFNRALANVDADPPAALTAACALLEAVCKAFIVEQAPDEMPAKSDLQPVWKVVASKLKFDTAVAESQDLRTIISGLFAVVQGIGALRTHDGSAHGQKPAKRYKIEPRHARLAVHAAHTVALFIIEAWERPK